MSATRSEQCMIAWVFSTVAVVLIACLTALFVRIVSAWGIGWLCSLGQPKTGPHM